MQISLWLKTIRFKTLSASVVPVLVMHAYAGRNETAWITICALLSAVFIQIGTNLFNDLKDRESGVDTAERAGPLRALHVGAIEPSKQKLLSHGSFFLALLLGVPLVVHGGLPVVIVGLLSILLGYAYSTGPFNLSRNGTGEIFVFIFFGIIPCMTLCWLHKGVITPTAIFLGMTFGLIATAILAINNLRDLESDKRAGRKTLAVRLGEPLARFEVLVVLINGLLIALMMFPTFLHMLWLPIAVLVSLKILKGAHGEILNLCLALTGLTQLLCGISIIGYFYA